MIHEHVVDVSYGEFAAIGHWCLFFFLGHSIHILYLLSHVSLSLENRIVGVGHHCHRLLFNLIVAVVDHHFPWFMLAKRVVEGQLQSALRRDSHAIFHLILRPQVPNSR